MKRVKIRWTHLFAVTIVMAAYVGISTSADHNGHLPLFASRTNESGHAGPVRALMRQGMTLERASRAIDVQEELLQANLAGRMETVLGHRYAGAWYEPATAQLHIGVTSPADRLTAELVAKNASLAAHVTETTVRSTWEQLEAVRKQWDRRLADLFAREQVTTWLDPENNSLGIELGTSVPFAVRVELERRAAVDDINVSVITAPKPYIRIIPLESRCKKFKFNEAFCDKPIVAGMSITNSEGVTCTAGPAVILTDLSKETLETFILTAGHCIKKAGETWYAYNKEGKEKDKGKKEIGLSVTGMEKPADIGVIEVKKPPGYWTDSGLTPVNPTIAPWGEEEPEPFAVTGAVKPVVKYTDCFEGQTTSEQCGTIYKLHKKLGTIGTEELVEVFGVTPKEGDSGGPVFSTNELSKKLVEGTVVAKGPGESEEKEEGEGVLMLFEPLYFSLEQLGNKYQLLTQLNKVRGECPMSNMSCLFILG